MSGTHAQAGYVSAITDEGYLVAVPLLAAEALVIRDMVFMTEQVITVEHVPPADPVVTSVTRIPVLQVGQEVIVLFLNGNLNSAAVIAARPMEG